MIETTVFLFCVSTFAMMILVRLLQELFQAHEAKLRAEESVMHSISGTRSRLSVYLQRAQELDKAAHHCLMGLDAEGTRAILEARRAVSRVDAVLGEIERMVEGEYSTSVERAAVLLTKLNGRPPRARISAPELYYPWEGELTSALDHLSLQIILGAERLQRAA